MILMSVLLVEVQVMFEPDLGGLSRASLARYRERNGLLNPGVPFRHALCCRQDVAFRRSLLRGKVPSRSLKS